MYSFLHLHKVHTYLLSTYKLLLNGIFKDSFLKNLIENMEENEDERLQRFTENNQSQNVIRSKKPSNSKFKQQKYEAWYPLFTAGTMFPLFFLVGIIFVPIGVGLYLISENINEIRVDYTDCMSINSSIEQTCAKYIKENDEFYDDCVCHVPFEVKEAIKGKIYMYYELENFYQNHRHYVTSRDDSQLRGKLVKDGNPVEPASTCGKNDTGNRYRDGNIVLPCGLIANSMFRDKIQIYYKTSSSEKSVADMHKVNLIRTGLVWASDKDKFKNPEGFENKSLPIWEKFVGPKNWGGKDIWDLDPDIPSNNGLENEDLIIWMRVSALPHFRKLYRIIDQSEDPFKEGLPIGNYKLEINYLFEVKSFNGTKSIILTRQSIIGGKNLFLGFAYFIVGIVCIVFGVIFLFIHVKQRVRSSRL